MGDTLAKLRTTRPRRGRKLRLLVAVAVMVLVNVVGPAVDQASAAPPSEVVWLNRDFRWTLRGPAIQCTNRSDSPFQTETTPARPGNIALTFGVVNRSYSCTDTATGNRLSVRAGFYVFYDGSFRATAIYAAQTTYTPGGGAPVDCSGPGSGATWRTNLLQDELMTGPASYWSQIRFESGGRTTCDDGTPIETFFGFGEGVRAT